MSSLAKDSNFFVITGKTFFFRPKRFSVFLFFLAEMSDELIFPDMYECFMNPSYLKTFLKKTYGTNLSISKARL